MQDKGDKGGIGCRGEVGMYTTRGASRPVNMNMAFDCGNIRGKAGSLFGLL